MKKCHICHKEFNETSQLYTHVKLAHRYRFSEFIFDKKTNKYKLNTQSPLKREMLLEEFYKSMSINPNHMGLTQDAAQSGYIRSSNNSYINNSSTPVNPTFRNTNSIGYGKLENKLKPINAMKQGFSKPLSDQFSEISKLYGVQEHKSPNSAIAGEPYVNSDNFKDYIGSPKESKKRKFKEAKWNEKYVQEDSIPYEAEQLKKIKVSGFNPFNNDNNKIDYKIAQNRNSCLNIILKLNNLKHIRVNADNGYTCLGVVVAIPDGGEIKDFKEHWTIFCMYVFLGVSTYFEQLNGFSIAARSSFGHIETTVADCWEVFRINVGTIGPAQEGYIADYLQELDELLDRYFKNSSSNMKDRYLRNTTNINNKLFKSDSGKLSQFQYAHDKKQTELMNLVHLTANLLEEERKEKRKKDIFTELLSMELSKDVSLKTKVEDKKIDNQLIHILHRQFNINLSDVKGINYRNYPQYIRGEIGSYAYDNYVSEKLTKDTLPTEDGYGSDSDEEIEQEGVKVFGKKIILPFAMRAIACAISAVHYVYNNFLKTKVIYNTMYYETGDINFGRLKETANSTPRNKGEKAVPFDKGQYLIGIRDINFFNNTHSYPADVDNKNVAYLIFDTTSATEWEIAQLIDTYLLKKANYDFIITVSSGTKHYSGGLDINSYGELRIFAKNKAVLNRIYTYITEHANTKATAYSNLMRKAFKDTYNFATNAKILSNIKLIKSFESLQKTLTEVKENRTKTPSRKYKITQNSSIKADNNCLFRTVSLGVYGTQEYHRELRAAAVIYMRNNLAYFREFGVSEEYLQAMSIEGYAWGGEPEIVALANLLAINIQVLRADGSNYGLNVNLGAAQSIKIKYCNASSPNDIQLPPNHYELYIG